MFEVQEVCSQ